MLHACVRKFDVTNTAQTFLELNAAIVDLPSVPAFCPRSIQMKRCCVVDKNENGSDLHEYGFDISDNYICVSF